MADSQGSDFIGVKSNGNGIAVGPEMKGPCFLEPQFGIVFKDRATGLLYSLTIENGIINLDPITV